MLVLRRLALGVTLIGLASLALALSDTARKSTEPPVETAI